MISPEEATEYAEIFIADKRQRYRCGVFASIKHHPSRNGEDASGTYYVEFSYAGPPVRIRTTPPRDHPTVVLVNDQTGQCEVMYWI